MTRRKIPWTAKQRRMIAQMVSEEYYHSSGKDFDDVGQKWDDTDCEKFVHEFTIDGEFFQIVKMSGQET